MSNVRGFLDIAREEPGYRNKAQRVTDYNEVEKKLSHKSLEKQAERCMDCGIPFCHGCGCPLSNLIPEWNELTSIGKWDEAFQLLSATNNFPEFTGRVCPALCEASCTIGLDGEPVSIRQIEKSLVENAYKTGYLKPTPPKTRTDKNVAIVGSGPAGLALADCLNKRGHTVTIFEKNEQSGGLLRYGIPDFKLDKHIIDRRINLMTEEGVIFKNSIAVGKDIYIEYLQKEFDAVGLTMGAEVPRDLPTPGRELKGIHFAMDFLTQQNRRVSGESLNNEPIIANGKDVIVIGGGDTGSDCVGTSIRQGAKSVTQIEIMPKPPEDRSEFTPWPEWPYSLRTSSSHKEGCKRMWDIKTSNFVGVDGQIKSINCVQVEWEIDKDGRPASMKDVKNSEFTMDADLVLLAMGFTGPKQGSETPTNTLKLDPRGNIEVSKDGMTSANGIFAAGDAATGASLVVRAMNSGRELADSINKFLE
jgi:glutamate synthase (NADPH) small chain